MKRFFFSVIATALAVSACTESGIIDTPEFYANEISFEPYFGKAPVTKAESIDFDYLTQKQSLDDPAFQVYAFLHATDLEDTTEVNVNNPYMNKEVWYVPQTTDTQAYWTYEGLDFWPDGKDLAFVAYNSEANECITSHYPYTTIEFSIQDDVEDQVDLLVTPFKMGCRDLKEGDAKVELVFKHLLTRVGFSVAATKEDQGVDIAIRSIKLCGEFPVVGVVDMKKNVNGLPVIRAKEGTATVESYSLFKGNECFEINSASCFDEKHVSVAMPIYTNSEFDPTEKEWDDMYEEIEGATDESRYMMIMPGNAGADARIEVEYQLTSDIKRTASVSLANWNFKAGFAYEFILKVSTESIDFSAQMGGWDDTLSNAPELDPLEPSL